MAVVMSAVVTDFHKWLLDHGRSKQTAHCYVSDIKQFMDWWALRAARNHVNGAGRRPSDLADRAAEYVTNMKTHGYAASTINRRMSAIRAFHKFYTTAGPGDSSLMEAPFIDYKRPPIPVGKPHPLPNGMADIDAMLRAAAKPDYRVLIGLCGLAGLRVREARAVRHEDFYDDHNGQTWLKVVGKGGVHREVPVSTKLKFLLPPMKEGGEGMHLVPLADSGAREAITKTGERAGIQRRVSSHDLRMTFGSALYESCQDIRLVQEILGHARVTTTQLYTGISERAKAAAVNEMQS
jgi:site-specific recombinase XerD